MSHTMKLLIAVGLALLAALLNWVVVSQRTNPVKFSALNTSVSAGETITTDMIKAVDVPASFAESIRKSVVPWNEMAVLSGKTALRDIEEGELLLWQDAPVRGPRYDLREGETALFIDVSNSPVTSIGVGEQISFRIASGEGEPEWVGPFRVVTVGDKRVPGERLERVDEISVAMKERSNLPQYTKLQDYIDRSADGDRMPLQIRAHVSSEIDP